MVPTKCVGYEPICQGIPVVVRPTIPMAVARPLNPPRECPPALGALGIFDHGHK